MRLACLAFLFASSAWAQSAKPEPSECRANSVVTRASAPDPKAPVACADMTLAESVTDARIGETPVEIVVTEGCSVAPWSVLNIHDDENTAVEAALAVLARRGGRLVELRHAGTRNLSFRLGGETFTVDPNRIFTDAGRARTLAALSRDTRAARAAVAAFADTLLAVYGTPDVVVALHNNTAANYSAASYTPGGTDAREAADVHLQPGVDPDDFVFVTTLPLFDAVVASGVNAVLQDNAAATDDGSLSVWAAQHGRPYVNVEAQHGHLAENVRMVEALRGWTGAE